MAGKGRVGFDTFFRGLPSGQDDKGLFRFFERKGENASTYYTTHGENARQVAARFYKTQSVVKQSGASQLSSVSLSPKMLVTTLRVLLLESNMNIEIWSGSGATWSVSRKASPGNLRQVEDLIATEGDADAANATIMAVHLSRENVQRQVGVACINTTFCSISVFEFIDDVDFKALEGLILQIGAAECLINPCPSSDKASGDKGKGKSEGKGGGEVEGDMKKLQAMLKRCHVKCTSRPVSVFSTKTVEDDLKQLWDQGSRDPLVLSDIGVLKGAMAALAACISFLDLRSDSQHMHRFVICLSTSGSQFS